jgi:geranylgeranyl pyrophosphate synthase
MSIIEKFQKLYADVVLPYILSNLERNRYTEPIFYTLDQPSNRFRSATAIIAARICGINESKVLPIAAVSEIIHTSLIIQDDIADSDEIRRGVKSAWCKFGTCHALFSSTYVIFECLNILRNLENEKQKQIIENFISSYLQVCKGQVDQSNLRITDDVPYTIFEQIYINKASIGIWSISSVGLLSENPSFFFLFKKFATSLGIAGCIKNDIESFLSKSSREPFSTDIKKGIVTFPLYLYYQRCSENQKKEFLETFGKGKEINVDQIVKKILATGIVDECRVKVKELVKKSIDCLGLIPDSEYKSALIEWAHYHERF